MRAVLSLFLSALLWATTCVHAQTDEVPYEIDEQATAQAPWKVGEIIAEEDITLDKARALEKFSRKFMGITNKGYFIVQDFYKESHKKATNPFAITEQDLVVHIVESHMAREYDGVFVVWYENGQKLCEGLSRNGKQQGLWTSWYEKGYKQTEGQFRDGIAQDLWILWHDNGQKKKEGKFLEGKEQGTWIWWYDNGQKQFEGQFQDGKEQGLWIYWNKEGKKISETIYENGEVVSEKTFD